VLNFSGVKIQIVILDACRNNPLMRSFRSASVGLVKIDAPIGSFIAYSTAPASVAADGKGPRGGMSEEVRGVTNSIRLVREF
jgi:uncharacterized caspase-like protein